MLYLYIKIVVPVIPRLCTCKNLVSFHTPIFGSSLKKDMTEWYQNLDIGGRLYNYSHIRKCMQLVLVVHP